MAVNKIQFDEQQFQLAAIEAIADIFEGQYAADSQKILTLQAKLATEGSLLADMTQDFTIRGNSIQISDEMLTNNIRQIQERNGIEVPSISLTHSYGKNYTIEMETGTGKTYVYIRTALELARRYGWRKFMIVVPSIAIKEGVFNSIDTMRENLEGIYNDVGYFKASIYDSKNTAAIGEYARSEDIELLITTIDSFKRQDTHMNREQEDLGWQKPIDILAKVQPIVIIDEPQSNMGEAGRTALKKLHALFTLRYSATHRQGEYYNLMYQFGPVEAHKEGVVKTIYVRSAGLERSVTKPYVKLLNVRTRSNGGPQAKIEFDKRVNGVIQKSSQWVNDNTDIEEISGNDVYRGYVIDGISAREGFESISFEGNSDDLSIGDSIGGFNDGVMKAQIKSTIEAHLRKELALKEQGIKVLSLFFVDRVSNYWEVDDSGNYLPGKIQKWFVEELKEQLKNSKYSDLYTQFDFNKLYDAYFSILRKKKTNTEQIIDEETASSADYKEAEAEAFERIMRDKKGLLDINTPLRFIFSHSALKEGWDNPNVFQICMMRDASSPLDRRQTIGRGLRLPVNQKGIRSFDPKINQLTVVANESYEEFALGLQNEYKSDGVFFGKIRSNAFAKISDINRDKISGIGFDKSKKIWENLVENGFINNQGELTSQFTPNVINFSLNLPDEFKPYEKDIISVMNDYELKNIIKRDNPVKVKYNKQILNSPEFNKLWDKINQRTTYRISFDTEKLIEEAANLIKNEINNIQPVRIIIKEGKMEYTKGGISGQDVGGRRNMSVLEVVSVPDIISFLQRETDLTRNTIAQILIRSEKLDLLLINPTEFKFAVLEKIQKVVRSVQVRDISYTIIGGEIMSFRKLEDQLEKEVILQLEKLYQVQNKEQTISDYIPTDSNVEKSWASKLDNNPNVEIFMKLPSEYKIPTPFGTYNPDWAYVYNEDGNKKLYLVRETKGVTDINDLEREREIAKIRCAQKHYKTIDVDYKMVGEKSPIYDGQEAPDYNGGATLIE